MYGNLTRPTNVNFALCSAVTSDSSTPPPPHKRVSDAASSRPNFALISSRCGGKKEKKKESHLPGTSLGEEFQPCNIAIAGLNGLPSILPGLYAFHVDGDIAAVLKGLGNIELSKDTSVSLLVMKSPAVE